MRTTPSFGTGGLEGDVGRAEAGGRMRPPSVE
jgi:hypothetical protein